MTLSLFELPTTTTHLDLPPVVYRQRTPVGEVVHQLTAGGAVPISSLRQLQLSPRHSEKVFVLANGELVMSSFRKIKRRPAEVDGVVHEQADGTLKWVSHRKLDEFRAEVRANGLGGVRAAIQKSWVDAFRFKAERVGNGTVCNGLRAAQIGALHAIGAHWSLHRTVATIVMPTGTGKTEAMIAALVAFVDGTLLVVVPSRVLRDQTVRKFSGHGLLRSLGVVLPTARNPIVGVVHRRPQSATDFAFIGQCNVVIGTIGALAQGTGADHGAAAAEQVSALIVDEAHHVPAESWTAYRDLFEKKRVLQFTATPFRRDGKIVDGRVIYNYPLRIAQADGYFKRISFEPVFEIDRSEGDQAIAEAAVAKLDSDIAAGRNHLLMARCEDISRATDLVRLYREIAERHNPILVHSEVDDPGGAIEQLRTGASRIVICVDMLGEGFDLPQLKIAAVHDSHKSLAVLMQFTGRFTRTADQTIGDATVIANIANQEVSTALERLYSEDADWNHLLSELSSEAIKTHFELVEFLRNSSVLGDPQDDTFEISHQLLRPKFSTVVYRADRFQPKEFFKGLGRGTVVQKVWLHSESNSLYFVTRTDPTPEWTRSRDLHDRQWELFVLHHDPERRLLYLHSSDKSSTHENLARAVSGETAQLIFGDTVFKTLGKIARLKFQIVGVKKRGRRNLRYAMYTGADVATALGVAETAGSEKSNLYGDGWENGRPVTIGCSYKGRVWSRWQSTIPELIRWCSMIGEKLQNPDISTGAILRNVLIPQEIEKLPDSPVLSIEWPIELLQQSEDRITLSAAGSAEPVSIGMFSIVDEEPDSSTALRFRVASEDVHEVLELEVGGPQGFAVKHVSGQPLILKAGRIEMELSAYLSEYPPLVKFVDLSELDGNLLVKPSEGSPPVFPAERFEIWDWTNVNRKHESLWKEGVQRPDSIQAHAAEHYVKGGFDVVFDDDSAGEAADLVCLKEHDDHVRLVLVHCKFTSSTSAGGRVKDVTEVCAQAVRSAKWKWRFRELIRHIATREHRLKKPYRATRFLAGDLKELSGLLTAARFKEVRAEVVIVQPGLSRSACTDSQQAVLASAYAFLKETVDVELDVICDA